MKNPFETPTILLSDLGINSLSDDVLSVPDGYLPEDNLGDEF